jgi:hypothetical protein
MDKDQSPPQIQFGESIQKATFFSIKLLLLLPVQTQIDPAAGGPCSPRLLRARSVGRSWECTMQSE